MVDTSLPPATTSWEAVQKKETLGGAQGWDKRPRTQTEAQEIIMRYVENFCTLETKTGTKAQGGCGTSNLGDMQSNLVWLALL